MEHRRVQSMLAAEMEDLVMVECSEIRPKRSIFWQRFCNFKDRAEVENRNPSNRAADVSEIMGHGEESNMGSPIKVDEGLCGWNRIREIGSQHSSCLY